MVEQKKINPLKRGFTKIAGFEPFDEPAFNIVCVT
jgi:hypothetical protein